MRKVVFLDRDGTLNEDEGYVHKTEDFKLLPGVIEGLTLMQKAYSFIIITNQSGIGRNKYSVEDMHHFNDHLIKELARHGIAIRKIFFCPHAPEAECTCRKPHTHFMKQAAEEFNIDLEKSWVIGDHPHDVGMAHRAGAKGIYLLTGHGKEHKHELHEKNIVPDLVAKDFLEAAQFITSNTPQQKIVALEQLKKIVENLKKKNKKIVTTNGVFDILHLGHVRYLQEARKKGDVLFVGINADSTVRQLKEKGRPINNENDRAEMVAALGCVDYVTLFSEKDPRQLLEVIKPEVHVKGGDYDMDRIIEKDVVEMNAGKVVLIGKVGSYSTTNLIKRIVDAHK